MVSQLQMMRQRLADETPCPKQVLVGFDGYIDAIVRPVQQLAADGTQEFFPTIDAFGAYLQTKAKKSCSIELAKAVEKSGGNAFLFSDALAALGETVRCVGAFGTPIDPLFVPKRPNLTIESVAPAGRCTAMEFLDGKVLLADNSGIDQMTFSRLRETIGVDRLVELARAADLLSFMNWSELKGSNSLWRGFLDEVFPQLRDGRRRQMFLDLSDCSVREAGDRLQMLGMIGEMAQWFDTALSVNANEFQFTAGLLMPQGADLLGADRAAAAKALFEHCKLSRLYIHMHDRAYGLDANGEVCIPTRFVKKPKLSTGGGDNFNAGLVYASLHGIDMPASMIVGNAASGYYITRGCSGNAAALAEYLGEWIADAAEE